MLPLAAATATTDNEFECRSTRHLRKCIGKCVIRNRSHPFGVVNGECVGHIFPIRDNKVRMELCWNGELIYSDNVMAAVSEN